MPKNLTITPSVPVWTSGDQLIFDRKFYDGILAYRDTWQGEINCVLSRSRNPLPSFGVVRKSREDIPFGITILENNEKISIEHLSGASVVLASGDSFQQFHLSRLCRSNNIKCAYTIEYIPETRYQIIDLEARNPIIRLRKHLYIWNGERQRVSAFKAADGLQINGSAAYDEYHHLNNCILYFDTRVDINEMITIDELEARLSQLTARQHLRLGFSGRLIRMKGADHLIELAEALKQRGIDFKFSIFGTGDLESWMQAEIERLGLSGNVSLRGAVDFHNELLPEIKRDIDLYVMLHRQSDPSCTYLETVSCGIPIVGYENKSLGGLLRRADIGWSRPIGDIAGIADAIAFLYNNRDAIKVKSRNCVEFSRLHDFKSTFNSRIKHLLKMVEQQSYGRPA